MQCCVDAASSRPTIPLTSFKNCNKKFKTVPGWTEYVAQV